LRFLCAFASSRLPSIQPAAGLRLGQHLVHDLRGKPDVGRRVERLAQLLRRKRPGDTLVLTKPLGTGVLFNACRSKKLPFRELEPLLPKIAALNRTAMETALAFDVHSCTDITGFGMLGHTLEMAKGSGVRIQLSYDSLPFHPHALEMYRKGETTGSNKSNRKIADGFWEKERQLDRHAEELLFDPQTSGGLLLALPASQAGELVRKLKIAGMEDVVVVGEVVAADKPAVAIL